MWTLEVEVNEDIAIISRRRVMLELYVSMGIPSIILDVLQLICVNTISKTVKK